MTNSDELRFVSRYASFVLIKALNVKNCYSFAFQVTRKGITIFVICTLVLLVRQRHLIQPRSCRRCRPWRSKALCIGIM